MMEKRHEAISNSEVFGRIHPSIDCDRADPASRSVWPMIAGPRDTLVDTVVQMPLDPDLIGKPRAKALPAIDAASPIWGDTWRNGPHPEPSLAQAWIAAQGTDVVACLRPASPARIIDLDEQQRFIADWSSRSADRAAAIGMPAFDDTSDHAWLHVETAGAGSGRGGLSHPVRETPGTLARTIFRFPGAILIRNGSPPGSGYLPGIGR